jgi:O-antigen ligase
VATLFVLIGFFYFFLENKKSKNKKISIYSLVLFFGLLFSLWPVFHSRFFSGSINETKSIEERVSGFSQAINLWQENKWLGVGISNYTINLYSFNSDLEPWSIQPVHNIGFLVLTELGLVGIILSILLISGFLVGFILISQNKAFLAYLNAVFCFSVLTFWIIIYLQSFWPFAKFKYFFRLF